MNRQRLTNAEISSLCSSLSHLIGAGISPADGLALIYAEEENSWLKAVYRNMFERLDSGATLCQAFKESGAFPSYVCSLLEVSDRVGRYESSLKSLAKFYDSRANTAKRLKASLSYPLMLLFILLAVIVVLLVWILPVFNQVYAQLGSGLSGISAWLLNAGKSLKSALPYIGIAAAVFALVLCIRPVRNGISSAFKKAFGDMGVFKKINSARFVQAYSMGIASGMTAQESLTLASLISADNNKKFRLRCERVSKLLETEGSVAKALYSEGFITKRDFGLIEIGQKSGHFEEAFQDVSSRAILQSEASVEWLLGGIEPAIVALSCLVIGIVLLSVMLPLINIMNSIG